MDEPNNSAWQAAEDGGEDAKGVPARHQTPGALWGVMTMRHWIRGSDRVDKFVASLLTSLSPMAYSEVVVLFFSGMFVFCLAHKGVLFTESRRL